MKSVDEIECSARTWNCLKNLGLEYVEWVALIPDKQLLECRNFGKKSLKELREEVPSAKPTCPHCGTGVEIKEFSVTGCTIWHPYNAYCKFSNERCQTGPLTDLSFQPAQSDYDHEACLAALYPDFAQVSAGPA